LVTVAPKRPRPRWLAFAASQFVVAFAVTSLQVAGKLSPLRVAVAVTPETPLP
jgi:hypothetical protein